MKVSALICLLMFSLFLYPQPPLQSVNTLIGTAPSGTGSAKKTGNEAESGGQTIPAAGRPFGMIQWTPETRPAENNGAAPYYYNDRTITGFRGSHWMSGNCTQDYGSITVMPFTTGKPDTLKRIPVSKFSHRSETASPSYYRVTLDNTGIVAEITGSVRSGFMRFTFPGKTTGYIMIRLNGDEKKGKIWVDKEKNEILGFNTVNNFTNIGNGLEDLSGYFIIRPDTPFEVISQLQGQQQIIVSIGNEKTVNVKTGSSFTSIEAAGKNLEREIPEWDFDGLRKSSEDSWNKALGKIQLKGGTVDDRIKFYSALYHCYLIPGTTSDADGMYNGFMQDTTLALHSLMKILEPENIGTMVRLPVPKAEQGVSTPVFHPCSTYAAAVQGKDQIAAKLNEFITKGQYSHGIASDLHIPFLFALTGKPEKTQEWVQNIISTEYGTGPGGLCINDNAGQISAWLVFAMMGFYPVCPESNHYVISTPAFDEVKVYLPDNKYFLISSLNRSNGINYIRVITRDGGRHTAWTLSNADILRGSRFTFQLDSKPPVK